MRTSQRNDKDIFRCYEQNVSAQQQLNILSNLKCFENVFVNKGYQRGSVRKKIEKATKKEKENFSK